MKILTRDELKRVKGGDDSGSNGCCAHTAGWGQYQCGYSSSSEAEAAASDAAQQCGCHVYYCCSCAGSSGYPG